jgi:hypothetical protein
MAPLTFIVPNTLTLLLTILLIHLSTTTLQLLTQPTYVVQPLLQVSHRVPASQTLAPIQLHLIPRTRELLVVQLNAERWKRDTARRLLESAQQRWVIAIKTKNSITKYITNYFELCNWHYQLR